MARFPTRTLILMTLALLSFAWFWWKTHQTRPAGPKLDSAVPVMVLMDDGGAP